jgi:hypothetical protein
VSPAAAGLLTSVRLELRARGRYRLTPLIFRCAKTVSEPDPFHPMNLLFERKQISRIVVTIKNSRKPIDRLEPISFPWAQGSGVQIGPPRPFLII